MLGVRHRALHMTSRCSIINLISCPSTTSKGLISKVFHLWLQVGFNSLLLMLIMSYYVAESFYLISQQALLLLYPLSINTSHFPLLLAVFSSSEVRPHLLSQTPSGSSQDQCFLEILLGKNWHSLHSSVLAFTPQLSLAQA